MLLCSFALLMKNGICRAYHCGQSLCKHSVWAAWHTKTESCVLASLAAVLSFLCSSVTKLLQVNFLFLFFRAMIVEWTGLPSIPQCHWLCQELMIDKWRSGGWMVSGFSLREPLGIRVIRTDICLNICRLNLKGNYALEAHLYDAVVNNPKQLDFCSLKRVQFLSKHF